MAALRKERSHEEEASTAQTAYPSDSRHTP
jgi:hypothetical protein